MVKPKHSSWWIHNSEDNKHFLLPWRHPNPPFTLPKGKHREESVQERWLRQSCLIKIIPSSFLCSQNEKYFHALSMQYLFFIMKCPKYWKILNRILVDGIFIYRWVDRVSLWTFLKPGSHLWEWSARGVLGQLWTCTIPQKLKHSWLRPTTTKLNWRSCTNSEI